MTIKRTNTGPGLPAGFPFSLAGEANGVCFISGIGALPFGAKIEIQAVAGNGK